MVFLQRLGLVAISGLVIPAVAACGGQQPAQSTVGVTPPMQSALDAGSFAHERNSHARPSTSECPCLYVANDNNPGSVEVYPANAKGDVEPIQDITGPYTGLVYPTGIAVDSTRRIYVTNFGSTPSVTVYAAGANGDEPPTQTISGSYTQLHQPEGVAVDPLNGDIYVADTGGGGVVLIFASNASGNVAPTATLTSYAFCNTFGIALDANANIYVANQCGSPGASVEVFPAGSSGTVAPSQYITGSRTKLLDPSALAVDSSANIYVSDVARSYVTAYSAGSNGDVPPVQDIRGKHTKLKSSWGVAVDGSDSIYVANADDENEITVYAAGASGNAKPIRTIKGKRTKLVTPDGLALR
jgi:serine/threonine protein kinase, bacterial